MRTCAAAKPAAAGAGGGGKRMQQLYDLDGWSVSAPSTPAPSAPGTKAGKGGGGGGKGGGGAAPPAVVQQGLDDGWGVYVPPSGPESNRTSGGASTSAPAKRAAVAKGKGGASAVRPEAGGVRWGTGGVG